MADVWALQKAIRNLHGCGSRHVESVPVREEFQGRVVWEGIVEVFNLERHPTAKRCFAWAHETDDGKTRYVAVLGVPPVDSARAAVKAAIVEEHR